MSQMNQDLFLHRLSRRHHSIRLEYQLIWCKPSRSKSKKEQLGIITSLNNHKLFSHHTPSRIFNSWLFQKIKRKDYSVLEELEGQLRIVKQDIEQRGQLWVKNQWEDVCKFIHKNGLKELKDLTPKRNSDRAYRDQEVKWLFKP